MKILLLLLLTMSLIACSGSKSTNEADQTDTGVALADSDEFSEDGDDSFADETFGDEEVAGDDSGAEGGDDFLGDEPAEEVADSTEAMDQETEMSNTDTYQESAPVAMSGEESTWTVSANETLMIIAFKIYGDYEKWRDIARLNRDKLGGSHMLSKGMSLRYETPSQPFVWNPEGNPYLIKMGDTLGIISNNTYGTGKYWKNIWHNNRPLIKNPNKIFAGFTIFTPIIDGRDVANQ